MKLGHRSPECEQPCWPKVQPPTLSKRTRTKLAFKLGPPPPLSLTGRRRLPSPTYRWCRRPFLRWLLGLRRTGGEVQEIDPSVLQPLVDQLAAERGFRVDVGHVALFGDCGGCEGQVQG